MDLENLTRQDAESLYKDWLDCLEENSKELFILDKKSKNKLLKLSLENFSKFLENPDNEDIDYQINPLYNWHNWEFKWNKIIFSKRTDRKIKPTKHLCEWVIPVREFYHRNLLDNIRVFFVNAYIRITTFLEGNPNLLSRYFEGGVSYMIEQSFKVYVRLGKDICEKYLKEMCCYISDCLKKDRKTLLDMARITYGDTLFRKTEHYFGFC